MRCWFHLLGVLALGFAAGPRLAAQQPEAPSIQESPAVERVRTKLELIKEFRAEPGSVVHFTLEDLNAWAITKILEVAPNSIRNPLIIMGDGFVNASALIDFSLLAKDTGQEVNPLLNNFLQGARPIKLSLLVESADGMGTVYVTGASISGVELTGELLRLFVENFLRPLYPEAIVNEPFEFDYNLQKVSVHPDGVRAAIQPR